MIIEIPYKSSKDGTVRLIKRYSDKDVQIRKVGTDEIYDEAIDVEGAPFEYEETVIPKEPFFDNATEEDYQDALREVGVKI